MERVSAAAGVLLVLVAALGAGMAPAAGTTGAEAGADRAPAQADCSFPITETDATGTDVTVEEEPERIVSLAPSTAQSLSEFDAFDKVVGVSSNADYLAGSDEKEVVSQATAQGTEYRIETIVGLQPDLVLAPNVVPNETVETLRNDGLTVYYFDDAENFEQLYDEVELTGQLAGECGAAEETVTDMRDRVTAIRDALSDEERPGAVYTFFGFVSGGDTFIDAIVTTAGTENVADTEAGITGFDRISEEVVADNPDEIEWLILNSDPAGHPSGDAWNETVAIRNDQTVTVNEDYLNQPAPHTVQALETITQAIHPEAYEAAQASLEATPTPEPAGGAAEGNGDATEGTDSANGTATADEDGADGTDAADGDADPDEATTTSEPTPTDQTDGPTAVTDGATTTGESGPGFTAGVALLALMAAGLFGRRR